MKHLYLIIFSFIFISCSTSKIHNRSSNVKRVGSKLETDSLKQVNYRLLKEYAVCYCLFAVPENKALEAQDMSQAVYSNLLNYIGVDTLSSLAKQEGLKIQPEKYEDYQGKKAAFFRCSQWANTPAIDSLIRKYAAFSVQKEVWEYDTLKKK